MSTSFYKITAVLLMLIVVAHSCVEPEEPTELPPETQTGENTFGCYVNGELFVAVPHFRWGTAPPYLYAEYTNSNGSLAIGASNTNEFFRFFLNPEENMYLRMRITYSNSNDIAYQARDIGYIFLTKFDLENRIVSGTFEYEVIDGKDTIAIVTEGRFDIKLVIK